MTTPDDRPRRRRPTLDDVCRVVGASRSTVSRAIRGQGRMREDLRRRITEACRDLGYRANPSARALRSSRTRTIGVLVQEYSHYQIGEILEGIQEEAQKNDYSVLIGTIKHNSDMELRLLESFAARQVEGILLSTTGTPECQRLIMRLREQGIHCVNMMVDPAPGRLASVSVDEIMGGFLATEHLIRLGHRDILFLGEQLEQEDYFGWRRHLGYRRAHEIHGIEVRHDLRFRCGYLLDEGYQTMRECLRKEMRFTAVFAKCDMTAAGAVKAIRDGGLRVPEDISVVGFDGSVLVRQLFPLRLTTVEQPLGMIGRLAFETLLKAVGQDAPAPHSLLLPPRLYEGETTARCGP
jgi:LacI family transcriptional regulator